MDYGETTKITKKLTVYGIVQGVGFRPLVYHIATKHNIYGTVKNMGGVVEIITYSTPTDYLAFLGELSSSKNGIWEIRTIQEEEVQELNEYNSFRIIDSSSSNEVSIVPPDISICKNCEKELLQITDRRFLNPFISCTGCGPRYTITYTLPYDRHTTTMNSFSICNLCSIEYASPNDRRFHAQTISCNDCGPYLIWHATNMNCTNASTELINHTDFCYDINISNKELINEKAFDEAISQIQSGKIIAVKGIGGYHFACSPFIEEAVLNLRLLKEREEKPFAVMFPNLDSIKNYCFVSKEEEQLLETKAKPIVLLYEKENLFASSTSKSSILCGAFLPYTPLQLLLTKACGPLIMTSANLSSNPIIKDDITMLNLQSPYLGGVLYHSREILRSVEDSVSMVINHEPLFIRRSRGYVPYPVFIDMDNNNSYPNKHSINELNHKEILALGSDLKATFTLYKNENAVVSQCFGDLEEVTVMEQYKESIDDLSTLLQVEPSLVICDMHPNYHSVKYGINIGLPLLSVQHHHAHIASVMAEHNIKEKIIGVAFDGSGYGIDGNIWGGEFLLCEGASFIRGAHLLYTPILGGDLSMKDCKKSATCLLHHYELDNFMDDSRAPLITKALDNNINTILTSSMGRLFDAVSSILNICDINRYEGEGAILLEQKAIQGLNEKENIVTLSFSYLQDNNTIKIDPSPLLKSLCTLKDKVKTSTLSLSFHYAVSDMILALCKRLRESSATNLVALSGGVFQNRVLLERTTELLKENNFMVYRNKIVPPNDGGISLGQTYIGLMKLSENEVM